MVNSCSSCSFMSVLVLWLYFLCSDTISSPVSSFSLVNFHQMFCDFWPFLFGYQAEILNAHESAWRSVWQPGSLSLRVVSSTHLTAPTVLGMEANGPFLAYSSHSLCVSRKNVMYDVFQVIKNFKYNRVFGVISKATQKLFMYCFHWI